MRKSTRLALMAIAVFGLPGWCYCAMTSSAASAMNAISMAATSPAHSAAAHHGCCDSKRGNERTPQREPIKCHCDGTIASVDDASITLVATGSVAPDCFSFAIVVHDSPIALNHALSRPTHCRAGPHASPGDTSLVDCHCLLLV